MSDAASHGGQLDEHLRAGISNAAGTLITDVACRRCGYNLRGLHRDGRCPECATAVGRSIQGDYLRLADPGWVRNLAKGSRYVTRALVGFVLLALVALPFGLVAAFLSVSSGVPSPVFAILTGIGLVLQLGLFGVLFYGIWLSTAPDPSRIGEDQYATVRKLTRITAIICAVGSLTDTAAKSSASGGAALVVLQLVSGISGLAMITGVLAYVRYLGRLAERIPDHKLVRRSRLLFRALAVYLGIMAAFALVSTSSVFITSATTTTSAPAGTTATVTVPGAARTVSPPAWLMVLLSVGGCASGLVGLVLFFLYLRWQTSVARAFEEQARLAMQTWAQQPGAAAGASS